MNDLTQRIKQDPTMSSRVSSKSGATGVCWRERIGKYQVRANVGGKTRHIGVFKTLEQAEEAAKKARALTGYSIGHGAPRMLALAGMESSA